MKGIFKVNGLKTYWTLIFMMNADQRQALLCLWLYNPKDNLTQSRKGRRGKLLKTFRHRDTEDTEKFKKQRTYNPNKGCKDLTHQK